MKASLNESLLNLAAHPVMWVMSRIARRVGPLWAIPGLGVLISDAEVAREVFQRDNEFTKNGPGSFAELLTAGLGPVARGNMDGAEPQGMRAAIAGVL